jgi:hypothetical protein
MSTNVGNNAPFLRTTRNFPEDPQALSVEISKSYLDIANIVNARTIGVYATVPIVTGNTWYVRGGSQKNQSLRQVYTFTAAGNIAHGINLANIAGFVAIYGTFTDGTIWYPLPYVNVVAANNQVSVTVTGTNIVITAGGGAPPTITKGFVVLEWLSNP